VQNVVNFKLQRSFIVMGKTIKTIKQSKGNKTLPNFTGFSLQAWRSKFYTVVSKICKYIHIFLFTCMPHICICIQLTCFYSFQASRWSTYRLILKASFKWFLLSMLQILNYRRKKMRFIYIHWNYMHLHSKLSFSSCFFLCLICRETTCCLHRFDDWFLASSPIIPYKYINVRWQFWSQSVVSMR
jgi:hypothetical protein